MKIVHTPFTYKQVIHSKIAVENNIDNFPGSDYLKSEYTNDLSGQYQSPTVSSELSKAQITLNLHRLFKYCINPIYKKYGSNLALTSVYRNKEVNKLLGGVKNSQHIFGYAADIVLINNSSTSILFNWCKLNLPSYHQLIWEYPEKGNYSESSDRVTMSRDNFSWIHISYIEGNNERINSVSSTNPKIHNAYQDENTYYLDNFTHRIAAANQELLEEE